MVPAWDRGKEKARQYHKDRESDFTASTSKKGSRLIAVSLTQILGSENTPDYITPLFALYLMST